MSEIKKRIVLTARRTGKTQMANEQFIDRVARFNESVNGMPCPGLGCPACSAGIPRTKRTYVKVLTLDRETLDMEISKTLADKIEAFTALKPTRWQRIKTFFRRLFS